MKTIRPSFLLHCAMTLLAAPLFAQNDPVNVNFGRPALASTNAPYVVSGYEIKGLWVGQVSLPLQKGDLWTAGKQSEVEAAMSKAFGDTSQSYLLSQSVVVGLLVVHYTEEKNEADHTVKVIIRPLRINTSLAKLGDNVLPIPRSPSPPRYEAVPAPVRALNPSVGVTYDRAFGTALAGGFKSDMLTLPDSVNGRPPASDKPEHLEARFQGAKSFDRFYRANSGIAYAYRHLGAALQEASFAASYDGTMEPLAQREHTGNAAGADAGAVLRLAAHTRLALNAGYRHASDLLESDFKRSRTDTEIQPNRILVESLLPKPVGGFFRAALWEDNGWSDQGSGFHQRLVGRAGYEREFPVAPNQTIGLELLGGGGRLWGDAPDSRRFFGGNSPGQFLYDDISDASLLNLPAGPLIRSFGEAEAVGRDARSARGGNAFWHINLNLTLPIRGWSFPLIPQEDEVRNALRKGIYVTGKNGLIKALKTEGMSPEAARAEAEKTFSEIGPATEYIIDEANLYSIKPLLMFDAAGLAGAGSNPTWLAAGGGVQLNIVTAKFELGYLYTLSGPTTGAPGNLFVRLIFQKLF